MVHRKALEYVKKGEAQRILTEDSIPIVLRERIWSFINGDQAQPSNSIPRTTGTTGGWFVDQHIDSNWSRYVDLLYRKEWRFGDVAIQNIETTTRDIMNFLFNPRADRVKEKYGLVVGHVQSGKTANYTGLIARAVDSGYNLIIVLAGLHNNLRRQTQIRLERELMGKAKHPEGDHVNPPDGYDWVNITTEEEDFLGLDDSRIILGNNPVIAIIKKNKTPLTKLRDTLRELPEEKRVKLNLLLVDDEADHATINTMMPKGQDDEDSLDEDEWDEDDTEIKDATTINRRVREILGMFPRSAYVGYTATPFANVLIDPYDEHEQLGKTLYPRDFIIALPKPEDHIGLEEMFPSYPENDQTHARQVKCVSDIEADELRILEDEGGIVPDFELPSSLEDAIIDFLLSGAARMTRGEENFHHSMLVHTKYTIRNQSPVRHRIFNLTLHWNTHLLNDYSSEGKLLRKRLEKRWEEEFLSHPNTNENWDEVWGSLQQFIYQGYEVVEINSKTEDSLDYDSNSEQGLRVIVVGGNSLSRGLTLEGLCSSFFIRETKMSDTLTQMGRWFGFRPAYGDLVRLHVTPILIEWFTWLTGAERELRDDIALLEEMALTPMELAVKIRKHQKMLPTGRSKMRYAVEYSAGLDQSCFRTKIFSYENRHSLMVNLGVTSELIYDLGDFEDVEGSRLWQGAKVDRVVSYLQAIEFHERDNSFNETDILNHINSRASKGELGNWSIALIHNSKGRIERPFKEFGFDIEFGLTTRSRLLGRETIGELVQPMHFAIDLPGERELYRNDGKFSYTKMYTARSPSNPLLLIYVIDKESKVSKQARQPREPLFSEEQEKVHLVGLAIAFPTAIMTEEERAKIGSVYAAPGVSIEP